MTVPAHHQKITNSYTVNYPEHGPRQGDPHYKDFDHYRKQNLATAKCHFGIERNNDFSECDPGPDQWPHGLELHHAHIEFALQNGVDLTLLEFKYPGVSNPDEVGAWVETGDNFEFRCTWHHRGHGGVHKASVSDYEAEHFIRNLIQR
jgi:hypothetical protein